MSSETISLLRSIRRWTIAIAFLLGIGVVAVADLGYILTGYQDELLWAITGVAGGVVALAAAVQFARAPLSGSRADRSPTE
jgi:hypothetical protein